MRKHLSTVSVVMGINIVNIPLLVMKRIAVINFKLALTWKPALWPS